MGKKNKKDKKGQGKEKTLLKTEKKASKRLKKELAVKGEVSRDRDYKNLLWGSVLDGSFQPKG